MKDYGFTRIRSISNEKFLLLLQLEESLNGADLQRNRIGKNIVKFVSSDSNDKNQWKNINLLNTNQPKNFFQDMFQQQKEQGEIIKELLINYHLLFVMITNIERNLSKLSNLIPNDQALSSVYQKHKKFLEDVRIFFRDPLEHANEKAVQKKVEIRLGGKGNNIQLNEKESSWLGNITKEYNYSLYKNTYNFEENNLYINTLQQDLINWCIKKIDTSPS